MMASFQSSVTLRCLSSAPQTERLSVAQLKPNLILPHRPSPRPVVAFSRRRNRTNSTTSSPKKNKQRLLDKDVTGEDDLDEDALEALFSQLAEDLKNDDPSLDEGDGEICEEDLAKLERELEEAFGDDELIGAFSSPDYDEANNKTEDDDHNDDEKPVNLKNWQLRRLAYALKNGRRKTSIKNLAADVCLDRSIVLRLLRDPPPNLLVMSAALPDKPILAISEPENELLETVPSETEEYLVQPDAVSAQPDAKVKFPVHVMQSSWSARKRLKKVQVETLERVYARTKRPTNSMINSIVHVTNLPRKRVVKWFEEKRTEDGVPGQRLPYQRSDPETVFNC